MSDSLLVLAKQFSLMMSVGRKREGLVCDKMTSQPPSSSSLISLAFPPQLPALFFTDAAVSNGYLLILLALPVALRQVRRRADFEQNNLRAIVATLEGEIP